MKEIEVLNQQIEYLQRELIDKIAKETVESIVTEAEDRIRSITTIGSQTDEIEVKGGDIEESPIEESVLEITTEPITATRVEHLPAQVEAIPTFHWPGSQELQQTNQMGDWFSDEMTSTQNIQQSSAGDWFTGPTQTENLPEVNPLLPHSEPQQPVVDNTKEELLNKIKALEFLLYNIDKEKEEAFQECTGMVNELTRLVYEKVNPSSKEDVPASTTSKREAIQPTSVIESQIMSEADIVDAASKKKELQSIEFEKTSPSLGEQSHPIIEEVMQPKRAYLTYQPDDKIPGNVKPEVFGENDDGWGWGPEEAKLEEEHQFKTESAPQVQNLRSEIARLNEALQVLQVERENHLEEIKQLQVKSGKLIKKCKELKQKNDQLIEKQHNKKSEGADFLDLDATIQEELKTQIAQLEKEVKEVRNELEKEKQEKGNVSKRVDVLTSANERMTEMKEIQDTEVLRWKRKCQEVEEKLQQYEWGSDGFNEGSKPKDMPEVRPSSSREDDKKIEELQQTIKELALDNEELQALLEEQRQIRINLEKAKPPPKNDRVEEELKRLSVLEEKVRNLEEELARKTEDMQKVLNERNSIYDRSEALQNTIKGKEENIKELQENLKCVLERSNEFERLLAENDKLVKDLQENEKSDILANRVTELEAELLQLNRIKDQQDNLLKEKETAFKELVSSFEQVNSIKEELSIQVKQLTTDLEEQREKYNEIQIENGKNESELQHELTQHKENFEKLKTDLNVKISTLESDLERMKQINDHLQAEGTAKINQLSQELEEQKQKYDQLYVEYTEKVTELAKVSHELQNKEKESSAKNTFEWAQEKYQLESLLAEKETASVELRNQKEDLEKQIEGLRHNLEQQQKDYEELISETEDKIARTAKELEEGWIIQVDQRGE